MSKSNEVVGDREVGSDDEADGELKKQEDAYANECTLSLRTHTSSMRMAGDAMTRVAH